MKCEITNCYDETCKFNYEQECLCLQIAIDSEGRCTYYTENDSNEDRTRMLYD